MKITVPRNELSQAVVFAHQGCGTRSPVYSGILLQAGQDGLRLTGSDGYVSFEALVPGEYDEGRVLLPGLANLVVPALVGEEIHLVTENSTVIIAAGKSRFVLQTLPATGYPITRHDLPPRGGVDAPDLARALRRVLPAVDTTGRTAIPALSGILTRQVQDRLEFLATDRFCLGLATCPFFPVDETSPEVIIPGSIIPKLLKLDGLHGTAVRSAQTLAGSEASAQRELILEWDQDLFRVKAQDAVITTRALQGAFPKWRRPDVTWLDVGPDFAPAVKRAAATGGNIALTFGDDLLVESTGEAGSFAEAIPFTYAEKMRLTLSPKMLLDGLAGCENAEIGFTEPNRPVYLRDDGYIWSLQPRKET